MRIERWHWTDSGGWQSDDASSLDGDASLVLVSGSEALLCDGARMKEICALYPGVRLLKCSISGEIRGTRARDNSLTVTAVRLERATPKSVQTAMGAAVNSRKAGERLTRMLARCRSWCLGWRSRTD